MNCKCLLNLSVAGLLVLAFVVPGVCGDKKTKCFTVGVLDSADNSKVLGTIKVPVGDWKKRKKSFAVPETNLQVTAEIVFSENTRTDKTEPDSTIIKLYVADHPTTNIQDCLAFSMIEVLDPNRDFAQTPAVKHQGKLLFVVVGPMNCDDIE